MLLRPGGSGEEGGGLETDDSNTTLFISPLLPAKVRPPDPPALSQSATAGGILKPTTRGGAQTSRVVLEDI